MEVFLEFLALVGDLFWWGDPPDEQRIEANITALMAYSWFVELVEKPQYNKLVQENTSVRYVIGKMKMKKMKRSPMYEERKEKKLKKEIQKHLVVTEGR
ncbi:hypothetical protein [Pseudalkalibacillus hwajinpoensis]|uniref:hypothetical protein n=1 Tax=Guptibacillus hwajinpoensis TaxID=208199 RepID=UPI001CD3D819|nr:hypothetical protein [Pseudalkalibacillus hwajinpoensis]MCA0991283.1 hypothetical protein [Pseudalkalibacillus hwajinpoensis]